MLSESNGLTEMQIFTAYCLLPTFQCRLRSIDCFGNNFQV